MAKKTGTEGAAVAAQQMFQKIWPGGLAAQAIYCAAHLRLADHLAGGPMSADALAELVEAHPPSLTRLLKALCSLDVLVESPEGLFALTSMGASLKSDHPSGVQPWALMLGSPFIWQPWGELLQAVRTGETPFKRIFGATMGEHLAAHPEDAEVYNTAMNAGAAMASTSVVESYDFSGFEEICDLGGGQGALLQGILEAYPDAHGILFDLPDVVATATALKTSDVGKRCRIVGGSFFKTVPDGADVYILKSILHAFVDEDASGILIKVREAMNERGRLLVCDAVLEETNEPNPQKALMDLMMLTLVAGHERTRSQFEVLLDRSGFALSRVIDTGRLNIVEGIPK